MLAVAAAAEASSEHPLARAVVDEALKRGIALSEVQGFEAVTGKGIRARLGDAKLTVGSPAFLEAEGVGIAAQNERIKELEAQGLLEPQVGAQDQEERCCGRTCECGRHRGLQMGQAATC